MIDYINEALRSMLHGEGKLPASDVDITFAVPSREWMAGIHRPTVNFFLYSITENNQFRETDFMVQRQGMQVNRRLRPRRVDLRFLITTHFKSPTAEVQSEEWQVLWRVLATLMRNTEWPVEMIPHAARELEVGIQTQVAQVDATQRPSEIFSALNIPVRAALHYLVTVPLDLNLEQQSTLAVGVQVGFNDTYGESYFSLQRYAWKVYGTNGEPLPGIEVQVSDSGGYSVSGLDGTFTTTVPHSEVKKLLVRRPDRSDWETISVKKNTIEITLPDH